MRPVAPSVNKNEGIPGQTDSPKPVGTTSLRQPGITLLTLGVDDLEGALRFCRDGQG